MKAVLIIGLFFWVAAARVAGGQQSTPTPASPEPLFSPLTTFEIGAGSSDTIVRKNVRLSGPLVGPMKARKLSELPRRLFHWINLFAPTEAKPELEKVRDLSPRAWTTMVGWHPGGSAFPDAVTHESSMGLVTLSRP